MPQESLKKNLDPIIAPLELFSRRLSNAIEVLRRTANVAGVNGTNGASMDIIMELVDHEFMLISKMRPLLKMAHKHLWNDANENLKIKLKEDAEALKARSPTAPKKKMSVPKVETKQVPSSEKLVKYIPPQKREISNNEIQE